MNTRILMTVTAIIVLLVGMALSFMPDELLQYAGLENTKAFQLILQILGALYFAFGVLDWMTKTNRIGGIYNRPMAVANSAHFIIAGLALLKGVISNPELPSLLWAAAVIYLILALCFGFLLFWHPLKEEKAAYS